MRNSRKPERVSINRLRGAKFGPVLMDLGRNRNEEKKLNWNKNGKCSEPTGTRTVTFEAIAMGKNDRTKVSLNLSDEY